MSKPLNNVLFLCLVPDKRRLTDIIFAVVLVEHRNVIGKLDASVKVQAGLTLLLKIQSLFLQIPFQLGRGQIFGRLVGHSFVYLLAVHIISD